MLGGGEAQSSWDVVDAVQRRIVVPTDELCRACSSLDGPRCLARAPGTAVGAVPLLNTVIFY